MKHKAPADYTEKFAQFIKLCEVAKKDGAQHVVVARPWVIGDNYAEVIESLSRLSEAGLALRIVEPAERAQ